MISFICGKETYRAKEKLKELIKKSGERSRLVFFNANKEKMEALENELGNVSMFNEKKVIVLKNVFGSEIEKEILQFFKKKNIRDEIVFIEKDAKKGPLLSFLQKEAKCYKADSLKGKQLRSWAQKEFGKYKKSINFRALENLIVFVGNDLWELSNEIKKIASFSLDNPSSEIQAEDISLLVKPKVDPGIFNTIDAIALRDKKRAVELLHQHLEKGDSPFYLFSMIRLQISNLLKVKDLAESGMPFSEIIKKSNLHPFVVKKSYRLSQKFSIDQLKKIYRKMFNLEIKIKTGKVDPVLALDILLVEV